MMKRTRFHTLLTSLLLVAFLADTTNALALYVPHRIAVHEISTQTDTKPASAHDELFKRAPFQSCIKFIDIDSPLLQPHIVASFFSETIHYQQVTVCENASPPASLISLHKLCILLI